MKQNQQKLDHWFLKNQHRMIHCPHQPGLLIISREACVKRHLAGLMEKEAEASDNSFEIARRKGLHRCRDCPIGRRIAAEGDFEGPPADLGHDAKGTRKSLTLPTCSREARN